LAHPGEQGQDRMLVMLLVRGQTDLDRSASGIHDSRQFGVQSTFGPAYRPGSLSTRRIGPVLMQLDMRAVQVAQFTLGVDREQCENLEKNWRRIIVNNECKANFTGQNMPASHQGMPVRST